MEQKENLLNDKLKSDLLKYGILDKDEKLNPKIDNQDFQNLISGGELLIERDQKAVLLSLDDSKLKIELLNNDMIKHKNVSSAEIYHLFKNANMYKALADYGHIVNFGKDHLFGDIKNEKTFFVVLENERGQTMFSGNDLEKKLANYKIGDRVQINNIGIEKKNIEFELNNKKESSIKYDNLFTVGDYNPKNKQVKNSLFELNKGSNIVNEIDTTSLSIKSVNGHYLSDKELDRLKKGKSISLDDGLEIMLSPKEKNRFNLIANSRNLLIGSLLIDGGISFTLIKTIQLIKTMITEHQQKQIENKYLNELQKLKGQLQQQAQKFPEDKSIINSVNIVDKEIQSVNSIDPSLNKKAEYTEVKIDLRPFEDSQEIQRLSEKKYQGQSTDDLVKIVKEKDAEYSKALQADNNSQMSRLNKDIKEIQSVINYRKQSNSEEENKTRERGSGFTR
ncbi:hypothetical protein NZD88_20790 [Chryseobacterium antibioticum]|uniref:DUF3945 domain-containing protein n=1 Tax=Chryseobacterium pyrolae TaxID=2987481 RepID=A0ABT2IMV8_9FLAO|nr:hypothetical protein [Chryseobacterium pyrolae]MCT2410000.1 hypothetical protein [Chryseobacterium pyrolae]